MKFLRFQQEVFRQTRRWLERRWVRTSAGAILITVATLWAFAQATQPASHPPKPYIIPAANPEPDANDRMQMNERHVKAQSFDAANTERLRQIAEESDMLVTMAMALKAEADNSNSGVVSPTAIRKAETIEKLAHSVKQKMELTVGN